ncbi:hypothetical protein WJX74_006355 [Apatococcus lobatus]|uniref:VCBS repeat-containing protein n=1 Tax=Apatococcus lobatus TaxID=904363 RepID=A0AAW1SBN6_9CHLO
MTNQNLDLSSPSGGSQLAVVTADFNCDGKKDFATVDVGGHLGGFVYVHIQQEHGTFSLSANLSRLSPVQGLQDGQQYITLGNLATSDVNGDGAADLFAVGTDFDAVPNEILLVWMGNGDGSFAEKAVQSWVVSSENADPALGLALADFNDGVIDIAVSDPKIYYYGSDDSGNPRGPGAVNIYLGDASSGQFSEESLAPIEVGSAPFDIKVCNFNRDSYPDLLITNYFSNTTTVIFTNPAMPSLADDTSMAPDAEINIWYNDGSGLFNKRQDLSTGQGYGLQLAAGYLDGDENVDLVIASSSGDIQFLQGGRDGEFKAGTPLHQPEEQRACGLALADFNGDGILDIVTADSPPLNPGDFLFAPRGGANVIINTSFANER